jgi:hypothetical protein
MVSHPIDLDQLVISSGYIVLILFDTLIDIRLKLYHPKGGWDGGGQVITFVLYHKVAYQKEASKVA